MKETDPKTFLQNPAQITPDVLFNINKSINDTKIDLKKCSQSINYISGVNAGNNIINQKINVFTAFKGVPMLDVGIIITDKVLDVVNNACSKLVTGDKIKCGICGTFPI